MKKLLSFVTALCMVCAYMLPHTALADVGQEMLDNTGFEGVGDDGIPWWWGPISRDNVNTSSVLSDTVEFHGGGKSALVSQRQDHNAGILQYIQTEKVEFEPGASYKMTAAVKPAGDVTFKFTFESGGAVYDMASGGGS